jgi:hypothetical protein
MFEAGRNNLFALFSNKTFPVSREVTLTPTIAEDSSGFAKISEMRLCNSERRPVGFDGLEGTALGAGLATGDELG